MTTLLDFNPPVIAHRGASAYAPENTIISFTKAAQLGIKWVEFDVMQAACGEPVIFHDDDLNRTSDGHGLLERHAYTYLQSLDAGKWFHSAFSGERIPNLRQVIAFLNNAKMSANVEIKAAINEEELILRVLAEIDRELNRDRSTILFSSFSISALKLLRQHAPNALLGLLLHEWEADWQTICTSLNCVSLHINHEIMTQQHAQEIKAMQKKLLCYTVNDPLRALELYSWGVDAVFSDAPDKIVAALYGDQSKVKINQR